MDEQMKETLELLWEVCKKYELKTLIERIDQIGKDMDQFSLKILFVGKFSAGKSALINSLLGRDILGEGLRPETAIAGELVYDEVEYVEAVADNKRERVEIEDVGSLRVSDYNFLIWHLDSEILKKLNGNTIVDMPGFNSGIKDHNKAILQYAGKGNAYILVIDSEEGAIKRSMMDFIDEIKNYEENLAVVITKTDLKIPEDVEKIENSIKRNAESMFGEDILVISTSKQDEFVQNKLVDVITSFNEKKIYMQEFVPQIYEVSVKSRDSLDVYKRSLQLNLDGFDDEIRKHEKSKKELVTKLEREKKHLEQKFKNSVVPSILADAQNALSGQINVLENSLLAGGEAFSMTVNNILRPILLSSTQRYVEQSFDEFLSEINFADNNYDEIIENALDKYRQVNSKLNEISKDSEKFNAIYKTITTVLSVATSIVAPWLELIIIFLPDIFKLFAGGNQKNDLRSKINGQIIPQIITKLRPEVERTLMDMQEEIIQTTVEEMQDLIDAEVDAIEKAKVQRNKTSEEHEKQVADVDSDIERLDKLIASLTL